MTVTLSLEGDDYLDCIREAAANRISGGAIYDALIARCAVQAGADEIFTWNTRHYQLLGAEVSKTHQGPRPRLIECCVCQTGERQIFCR